MLHHAGSGEKACVYQKVKRTLTHEYIKPDDLGSKSSAPTRRASKRTV